LIIAGFLQTFNEGTSGHLARFIDSNLPLLDLLCVYDDGSSDNTIQLIKPHADLLIAQSTNLFKDEISNKSLLLDKAKELLPSIEWFLWLDADEVLLCSRGELEEVVNEISKVGYDGATLPHFNLWRSTQILRTDEYFDKLRPVRLWRNSSDLKFTSQLGLHNDLHPGSIRSIATLEFPAVVHFGFASDNWILKKYLGYKFAGQHGWPLNRLISETDLQYCALETRSDQLGARFAEFNSLFNGANSLQARSHTSWSMLALAEEKSLNAQIAQPKISLVCLIYNSCEWLESIYGELLAMRNTFSKGEVEILFVANDANSDVLNFLSENRIPHITFAGRLSKDEWFINSVYRAYNEGIKRAKGEFVLLINSDMAFAENFLLQMARNSDRTSLLVGRLIESGVMESGLHAIQKNFGTTIRHFNKAAFLRYARQVQCAKQVDGGLYMPLMASRELLLNLGLFPEGNLSPDALSSYIDSGVVSSFARNGERCIAGDHAFIMRAAHLGVSHKTDFSAVAYHFQCGEMRSTNRKQLTPASGIAVINDHLKGINGEEVLWQQLCTSLREKGARVYEIEYPGASRFRFHLHVRRQLKKVDPQVRTAFINATYSYPLPRHVRTISLRQDKPSDWWTGFWQRRVLVSSALSISNDARWVSEKTDQIRKWLPVPLASQWNIPAQPPRQGRKAIFVGAFNETKGWSQVRELVLRRTDISWTIVSKYPTDQHLLPGDTGKNWRVFRCLSARELRSLMDDCSVFVVGSPFETQCLAAIEAASRNLIVVMPPTGLLGSLDNELNHMIGVFSVDLECALNQALSGIENGAFSPRETVENLGLLDSSLIDLWSSTVLEELERSFVDRHTSKSVLEYLRQGYSSLKLRIVWIGRRVVRPLMLRVLYNLRTKSR
jgi:glycosyltransferase involved in cell wall biosynthesis